MASLFSPDVGKNRRSIVNKNRVVVWEENLELVVRVSGGGEKSHGWYVINSILCYITPIY